MANRVISLIILIPLAIILIALSVANRQAVTLTLDPFNPGNPALSYSAPLFIWLFGALVVGLIVGALATWLTQGKHRKRARLHKQEAASLLSRAKQAEARASTSTVSGHISGRS